MADLKETFNQFVSTSVLGFATKILSILISSFLDNYMNHNMSNFIGLTVNASLDFFMMKKIFHMEEMQSSNFVARYTISVITSIVVAQILYMSVTAFVQKHHKDWYKNKWNKYVFYIRYVIGAVTYGFVEFPLHKFWVFQK